MLDRRSVLVGAFATTLLTGCHTTDNVKLIRGDRRPHRKGNSYSADVVIYGATPTGIAAAVAAAREGASVIVVGGWREKHVGGMMGGGLGWTDVENINGYGGYARRAIQSISGKGMPGNPYAFHPVVAREFFLRELKAAHVPFIVTKGVAEVTKVDRKIVKFTTTDGLSFSGQSFIDGSYEGDLIDRAGVSTVVGREAASKQNPLSGFMSAQRDVSGDKAPFWRTCAVSPFNVENDPASGLLPGVRKFDDMPRGSADKAVPAYTFRLLMTKEAKLRIDLPSSPPDGYVAAPYEPHLRYIEALQKKGLVYGKDWTFEKDFVKADEISPGVFDVNNKGYFSTDFVGGSQDYPKADYNERARIWTSHINYILGLFYTWGWSEDPRIPPEMKREVRNWGLVRGCFEDPYPGDKRGWPYQLYVREARRMDNGLGWSGADLDSPDDQPSRNPNAIALASYMQDSHAVQRIAMPAADGSWALMDEGGFGVRTGGKDGLAPLPYELIVPHVDECTNLLSCFCVASSHQAFSSIRMEMTSMAIGEAAGLAVALMVSKSSPVTFQTLPYVELSRLINKSGSLIKPMSPSDRLILKMKEKLP